MDAPGSDADLTIAPATGSTSAITPRPAPFGTGAIIAGRYRLVALLGRGGMGEVYRADDLTLDQVVALKFLPHGTDDPAQLAQFHNELRVARQVSHKNVCRLYDLGEANGRRFLTMEYVDGEDFASVVRRIGRVPEDKALEIARQLCAGVAAAHERGVLHRDLKPANVMLDGEGHVRITDFGIATATAASDRTAGAAPAAVAGTPQYMAPELLAGAPASIASDLYALGLVLFEIFTGRRAYEAKTLGDLKALHDTGALTTPTSIVRDLDPAIERVILRCLAKDPALRPASALAVAAALPGGDPVAAALAAGETPSPAMLAAAAETEALPLGRGLAAVGFIVAGLILITAIAPRISVTGRVAPEKPPAVLADRAQQILKSFGYSDPVADSAAGMTLAQPFIQWLAANDQSARRWERLTADGPPTLIYWQRTSPRPMLPWRTQIQVSPTDPPLTVSGMTTILVDAMGRVVEFQAVPPQFESEAAPAAAPAPRWERLFDAAGLDMSTFTPAAPQWSPRDFADTRAAWTGPMAGHPEYPLRIEAAAYRGRPTSMFVLGPGSRPTRMAPLPQSVSQTLLRAFVGTLLVALMITALVLARHNFKAGRADRRAATRLALFVIVGYLASWVVAAHHVQDVPQEMNSFLRTFGSVLMAACIFWVVYLALEPYVRRFWPDGILGWTRLMSGYVRDPRVGRDVLVGAAVAVTLVAIQDLSIFLLSAAGYRSPAPTSVHAGVAMLINMSTAVSQLFDSMVGGMFSAFFVVLAYVLLRLALRRTWVAITAGVVLFALVQAQAVLTSAAPIWAAAAFQATVLAITVTVVVRFGLLVSAVAAALGNVLLSTPLTYSQSHWTATTSNLALAVVLGLTAFGFYAASLREVRR